MHSNTPRPLSCHPLFLDVIIQFVHKCTAVASRVTVWAHVLCDALANLLDFVLAQTVFDRTEAGIGEALLPVIPRGPRFARSTMMIFFPSGAEMS